MLASPVFASAPQSTSYHHCYLFSCGMAAPSAPMPYFSFRLLPPFVFLFACFPALACIDLCWRCAAREFGVRDRLMADRWGAQPGWCRDGGCSCPATSAIRGFRRPWGGRSYMRWYGFAEIAVPRSQDSFYRYLVGVVSWWTKVIRREPRGCGYERRRRGCGSRGHWGARGSTIPMGRQLRSESNIRVEGISDRRVPSQPSEIR